MGKAHQLSAVLAMSDTLLKYREIHQDRFLEWATKQEHIFGTYSRRRLFDFLRIALNREILPPSITTVEDAIKYIKRYEITGNIPMTPQTQNPAILNLIEQFCKLYNCTWAQLTTNDRHAWIVECRYLLMYYLFNRYRLTNSLIARMFNKDHTTVLHGIRKINDQMEVDVNFREYVERMDALLDINFTVKVEEIK